MKTVKVSVSYLRLVDAAPLIIAQEMGFAETEGVVLDLIPASSWSSVRDLLAFGQVEAAHMLSPVPVAMAMGLGGVATSLMAVMVTSVNGNLIGVSASLEDRLRAQGYDFDFASPDRAASALANAVDDKLIFGVPFPFSMHMELLNYWFECTELGSTKVVIRTVPPPLMADALASGEIDAFCVGEPWGSVAVDQGAGALLLPGNAIWASAPEKVLAVRTDWGETNPEVLGRIMRAVWRAGQWLARPEQNAAASEILSHKNYLDVSAELIDRALAGQFSVSRRFDHREVARFVDFHRGATNFPWRSQAKWIAQRLGQRHSVSDPDIIARGVECFRSDLFRLHMLGTTNMPIASEKAEGTIRREIQVAAQRGHLLLPPDTFFDGSIFDPDTSN